MKSHSETVEAPNKHAAQFAPSVRKEMELEEAKAASALTFGGVVRALPWKVIGGVALAAGGLAVALNKHVFQSGPKAKTRARGKGRAH